MPRFSAEKPLTKEQNERLLLLLNEAKVRQIDLPEEAKIKTIRWPIAPNGYFIRDDGKLYNPSDAHRSFINSDARYVMLYGSRGCGKSGAGSQKALRKIKEGKNGIIINPDFENLKISTWPEFKRWVPWDMVIPSQRHRHSDAWEPHQPFSLVFLNGTKVFIKGGSDASSSRGPNVNWFWYDEGGRDETGLTWQITNAGVRIGDDVQAWCTETPKTMEHWSNKFFIEKNIPLEAKEEFDKLDNGGRILIEWFHATTEDNKENLDPGFYAYLLTNYPSGYLRRQEVEGEFANEGGQIGNSGWFNDKVLDSPPDNVNKKVRFWDLAATEKKQATDDPDEMVGSLISKFKFSPDDKVHNFCIENQVCGFWNWDTLLDKIANVARGMDGPSVTIVLEEEPGSGGKNQVAAVQSYFKRFPDLSGYKVVGQRARDVGDRVMAANHWFATAEQGHLYMVKGDWNSKFLAQLDGFTQVLHDDRVTSVTGAMTWINPFRPWSKVPFLMVSGGNNGTKN